MGKKKNESARPKIISTVDENDNVVAHQILQLCQPLSWTVEAQSPALGGYNESIELAVQKITEL